eukprot:4628575-Amphidinium_carterae.2
MLREGLPPQVVYFAPIRTVLRIHRMFTFSCGGFACLRVEPMLSSLSITEMKNSNTMLFMCRESNK